MREVGVLNRCSQKSRDTIYSVGIIILETWNKEENHNPDPRKDPESRTPNSGLQDSDSKAYRARSWIYFWEPPRGLGSNASPNHTQAPRRDLKKGFQTGRAGSWAGHPTWRLLSQTPGRIQKAAPPHGP